MRISHDLREQADSLEVGERTAVGLAMREKAAEFVAGGSELYR